MFDIDAPEVFKHGRPDFLESCYGFTICCFERQAKNVITNWFDSGKTDGVHPDSKVDTFFFHSNNE